MDNLIEMYKDGGAESNKRAKGYDWKQQCFERDLQMLRNFDVIVDNKVKKGKAWIEYMNSEYTLAKTSEQRQKALKDALALLYME